MNRLCRLMYASRGLHGHQGSSELRLRGWALLLNFRPYAPRSNQPRTHDSPAHRLNGKRYHEHWLHNCMASTSLMGFRTANLQSGRVSEFQGGFNHFMPLRPFRHASRNSTSQLSLVRTRSIDTLNGSPPPACMDRPSTRASPYSISPIHGAGS